MFNLRFWQKHRKTFLPPLLMIFLVGCSYTSAEDLAQKRLEEGTYVVYWKNRDSGFQSKMKGLFDHETAVDLAERKQIQRPENEYWVERVR